MDTIIKILVTALAAYLLQKVLPGVHIGSFGTAVIFTLVLGLLNAFVKPVLEFLGLPLTVITLGIFSFVINAVIILLCDYFIKGMNIEGFWWALVFSILLSLVSSSLHGFFSKEK